MDWMAGSWLSRVTVRKVLIVIVQCGNRANIELARLPASGAAPAGALSRMVRGKKLEQRQSSTRVRSEQKDSKRPRSARRAAR